MLRRLSRVGDGRARLALWAAVSLLALAPVVLVRVPPWYDYHNWVFQARIITDLLGHGPDAAAAVRPHYGVHWWPVPNLATPLGMAVLALAVGPGVAGHIFVGACVLAFAYAFAYLVRSVQERPSVLEYLALPWALGYFFAKGYTSYLVSLPLAFVGIGLLHRISRREQPEPTVRELAALAALGAGAYLSHLLGWGVFMVALAVYGLDAALRGHRGATLRLWATALPAVAMLVTYTALRMQAQATATVLYAHGGLTNDKLISLVEPLMLFVRADPFPPPVPLFWANLGALAALAAVVAANVAWRERAARPLLVTGVLLGAIALALPYADFGDLTRPDERFVLPAALLFVAALRLKPFGVARGAALAGVLALVVALHVVQDVRAGNATAQIQQATLAAVPADARMISLTVFDGPTHGGCSRAAYQPSFGTASLRWAALLETSVLYQRAASASGTGLTVDVLPRTAIDAALAAQYARTYPYVEVLGCPAALADARAAFAGAYRVVASGEYFAIFTAR